jgi:outer membrane protein
MKMSIWRGSVLVVLLALLASVMWLYLQQPKTAYVNTQKLYAGFQLKKELDLKLTQLQQSRMTTLDSLKSSLTLLTNSMKLNGAEENPADPNWATYTALRDNYLNQEAFFESDTEQKKEQYLNQIWTQLNQYVSEYGKEQKLDYVLGGDGSGSVMYARDAQDITDDVLAYVNSKYQGIQKK